VKLKNFSATNKMAALNRSFVDYLMENGLMEAEYRTLAPELRAPMITAFTNLKAQGKMGFSQKLRIVP
jgi:hypothetical protein